MEKNRPRLWIARILIGLVAFFNLECAAVFLVAPQVYAPGFELTGEVGNALIRGMGILFLMWNVPYLAAFSNPINRRFSLFEALAMQTIGLAGETILLFTLAGGHTQISATVQRFILFDGIGLAALLGSVWAFKPVK